MKHQFTREQVRKVAQALDKAGVPVLEVTHGDGLAGSSIQYGFSRTNEFDRLEDAARSRSPIAAFLPGIGTRILKDGDAGGIQVVRIATQCRKDIAQQHFGGQRNGLEAVGF
jgi:4-hydroxy 2-oxovalerate aldolase